MKVVKFALLAVTYLSIFAIEAKPTARSQYKPSNPQLPTIKEEQPFEDEKQPESISIPSSTKPKGFSAQVLSPTSIQYHQVTRMASAVCIDGIGWILQPGAFTAPAQKAYARHWTTYQPALNNLKERDGDAYIKLITNPAAISKFILDRTSKTQLRDLGLLK
jgi:hypothetical protein